MFCPKCGAQLKEGAKFCHVCGFNIIETPVVPPPPQPQQQTPPPPQQQKPFQNFNEADVKAAASNIFTRASNIMFKTKAEWQAISMEKPNTSSILFGYAIPLALIPAIFSVIGYGLIGVSYGWGFKFTSWTWGLEAGITSFISAIAAIYITSLIVDALAPSFKAQKNFGRAMQLVVYSFTPMWVAGVLNFYPPLAFIALLAGIYGLYLLYVGMEFTMKPAKESQIGYFFATLGIVIVVYFVLSLVLGAIFMSVFGVGTTHFNFKY
jgi:hypothetical protein